MRRLAAVLLTAALLTISAHACTDSGPSAPEDEQPASYSHVRSPGSSANDFLSGETFDELVVEVDYMAGYAPNTQALDSLKAFLETRLNKASVTISTPTEIAAGGQDTYTADEIRSLEQQHRDVFTDTVTLAAYMMIVDGRFERANVLGIAYYNTSNAFFGAAYDEISGGLGQPSRFLTEATSFRHEFGHLFGLVAIEGSGTDMQTEHQDEPNGHHCDNNACLMYYAMESTDLFGSVFGGEIPALDANCIADLRANGGR